LNNNNNNNNKSEAKPYSRSELRQALFQYFQIVIAIKSEDINHSNEFGDFVVIDFCQWIFQSMFMVTMEHNGDTEKVLHF
jgi:hypothetical protein